MYPDLRVVFSTSSLFNILNVNPSVVFPNEMQGLSYWQMI